MSENPTDLTAELVRLREAHKSRCEKECTRDVIFLFQRRRLNLIGLPAGFDCSEGYIDFDKSRDEYADDLDDHGVAHDVAARLQGDGIPLREFADLGLEFGEWGQSCVTEEWITERVWLDRDEATRYGERRAYDYADGWRVYGVPTEGMLSDLLRHENEFANNAHAIAAEAAKLRERVRELEASVDRLKHRMMCDSCCGEKPADCVCMNSEPDECGSILGQRTGLRRMLLAARRREVELEAEAAAMRELLLHHEWQEDLDETACPTGGVHCAHCEGGGGSYKTGRRQTKTIAPSHTDGCPMAAALSPTAGRDLLAERERDKRTIADLIDVAESGLRQWASHANDRLHCDESDEPCDMQDAPHAEGVFYRQCVKRVNAAKATLTESEARDGE